MGRPKRSPDVDFQDKSLDVSYRLERAKTNLGHHEREAAKYREIVLRLAKEQLETGLGLEAGQYYDIRLHGKVQKGKYLEARVKGDEYMLRMEIQMDHRTVIRNILPFQILGYENIPKDRIKSLFSALARAEG
jgi:hypothetical protein